MKCDIKHLKDVKRFNMFDVLGVLKDKGVVVGTVVVDLGRFVSICNLYDVDCRMVYNLLA